MKTNCTDHRINKAIEILYTIPDMSDLTRQKVCDYMTKEMSRDIQREYNKEEVSRLNETCLYKIYAKKDSPTYFCIPLSFYGSGENRIDFKCHKYYFDSDYYNISRHSLTTMCYDKFDDIYEEITLDEFVNRIKNFKFINIETLIEDIKENLKEI